MAQAARLPRGLADLLVLDVPCGNTAVLARRPEARYRFSSRSLKSLVELQRRIAGNAQPLVRPGGHVLYATCSLEPEENRAQAAWMATQLGWNRHRETLLLPEGADHSYRDGGYFSRMTTPCSTSTFMFWTIVPSDKPVSSASFEYVAGPLASCSRTRFATCGFAFALFVMSSHLVGT
jgi:hypothetical protein